MARQSKSNKGSTRVYAPTHYPPVAEEPEEKAKKKKPAKKGKSGEGRKKFANKKDAGKSKRGGKNKDKSATPKAKAAVAQQETIMVPIELLGDWGRKAVKDADKPQEEGKKKRSKRSADPKTILNEDMTGVGTEPVKPKKREGSSAKRVLSVLIALVSFAGLISLAYFLFLVDEIEITGNNKYSSELIRELSGLETGRHILLCDTKKAAANIETTAYIKVLEVKREFPRTIRVSVLEREEAAVILGQSYDVIIDIEGHVLSIGASSDTGGLLRVLGMSQHGFLVNQSVGTAGDVQAATLKLIMQNLSSLDMMGEVVELNMSNPLRVSLKTISGVEVLLGQADNLEEKLGWMKDTLPSLNAAGIEGGTLDVGAKGGPIYSPPGARENNDDELITDNEAEDEQGNDEETATDTDAKTATDTGEGEG